MGYGRGTGQGSVLGVSERGLLTVRVEHEGRRIEARCRRWRADRQSTPGVEYPRGRVRLRRKQWSRTGQGSVPVVRARRVEVKAALKAQARPWMLEKQLATMQIDDVTDDGSVNLGCDKGSVLDYGY